MYKGNIKQDQGNMENYVESFCEEETHESTTLPHNDSFNTDLFNSYLAIIAKDSVIGNFYKLKF